MIEPPPLPQGRTVGTWSRVFLWVSGLFSLAMGGCLLLLSAVALVVLGPAIEELRVQEQNALGGDRSAHWREVDRELKAIDDPTAYQTELDKQSALFIKEALLRLNPELYLQMSFVRYIRVSLWLRLGCGVLLIIGGLLIGFRKLIAWRMLVISYPLTLVSAGIEGVALNRSLPQFWNALRVDSQVVYQQQVDEIGEDGFWLDTDLQFLNNWAGDMAVGPTWIVVAAIVPFLLGVLLSLPFVRRSLKVNSVPLSERS